MKKITLALCFMACMGSIQAQEETNYYVFSTFSEPYSDLTTPISINNGVQWYWDDFEPISLSFPVSLFGVECSELMFYDDYFMLGNFSFDQEFYSILDPLGTYLMDRGYYETASESPISYKIEGTEGSRILKMEIKNAGFENEDWDSGTLDKYISYQIWYYEADESFEIRLGPHNLTTPDIANIFGLWIPTFGYIDANEQGRVAVWEGDASNPTYLEFEITDELEYEPTGLTTVAPPNTVFRLQVNPLAINDQEKVSFALYPNPAQDVLHLTFEEAIDKSYAVYDVTGRQLMHGNIDQQLTADLSVAHLAKGTYVLRIGATSKKFVKN